MKKRRPGRGKENETMSKIMRKSETAAEAMARHRMENIEGVTEETVALICTSTENTIRHAIQNGDFACGIKLTQERFKAAVAEAIYIAAIAERMGCTVDHSRVATRRTVTVRIASPAQVGILDEFDKLTESLMEGDGNVRP